MDERPPIAFMSWRDLVITPLVWFGLLALAVVATVLLARVLDPDVLLIALIFYAVLGGVGRSAGPPR